MDQFEAARLKTAKREEMKLRYAAERNSVPDVSTVADSPPVAKVVKEKPFKNGVFTISVNMPHLQCTFVLVKESVLSHAPKNRLTQAEIRKHVVQGLRPLLGEIE